MNFKWQNLGRKLGGFHCATLKSISPTGEVAYEDALAGKHGEIWFFGADTYRALFLAIPGKTEILKSLKSKDLNFWRKRLKVPLDPEKQAEYANSNFR